MLNIKRKLVTASLIVAAGIGTLAPMAAQASEAGQRNTTLALGAITAVLAAKGQLVPAAIAGVGTVVAEQKWQDSINQRHDQEDWRYDNRNDRRDYRDNNNNNWSRQTWDRNKDSHDRHDQDHNRH